MLFKARKGHLSKQQVEDVKERYLHPNSMVDIGNAKDKALGGLNVISPQGKK